MAILENEPGGKNPIARLISESIGSASDPPPDSVCVVSALSSSNHLYVFETSTRSLMNLAIRLLQPALSFPPAQQPPDFVANAGPGKRARATGENLEYLKLQFSRSPNPSIDVRRDISARTGMHDKAIRVWFQNYRAKMRKSERMKSIAAATSSDPSSELQVASSSALSSANATALRDESPILSFDVNPKYSYIEISAISAGTWERARLTFHPVLMIARSLHHLSPKAVLTALGSANMLIILSKHNSELNYFFVPEDGSRMLYRVFYPLSKISDCRLISHTLHEARMQISLAHKPQFAIHYPQKTYNTWEMSPDFTEGNQISSAHSGFCGNSQPHILKGPSPSLEYLRSYISTYMSNLAVTASSGIAPITLEAPIPDYNALLDDEFIVGSTQLAPDDFLWSIADIEPLGVNIPVAHPPTPASSTSKLQGVYANVVSNVGPALNPLTPHGSYPGIEDARYFQMEQPGLAFPQKVFDFAGQQLYAPPAAPCGDPNMNDVYYSQDPIDIPIDAFENVNYITGSNEFEANSAEAFAELMESCGLDAFFNFGPEDHGNTHM